MLESAAADAGRVMRWVRALGQASDHPVILQIPETGYLKGALLEAWIRRERGPRAPSAARRGSEHR
jgi:hypothetical protein